MAFSTHSAFWPPGSRNASSWLLLGRVSVSLFSWRSLSRWDLWWLKSRNLVEIKWMPYSFFFWMNSNTKVLLDLHSGSQALTNSRGLTWEDAHGTGTLSWVEECLLVFQWTWVWFPVTRRATTSILGDPKSSSFLRHFASTGAQKLTQACTGTHNFKHWKR